MLQFVQREMVASESPSQFVPLFRAVYSFITAPQDRKELIIGKRQPRVDENATLTGDYGEFNELQLKIKQAQELFVLVGPPGTGKTSYGMLYTVQEALTEEGSEVAIMAYTNRAVDEICEKLQEHSIAFTRIGQEENCAPAHKPYMLDNQVMKISKLLEIKEFIQGQRVIVGTTTAFNSHPQWFKLKNFTHCIIDEAAQLIDPQILNVLVSSRSKVILIGDHKQLPAVTREKAPNSLFIRTLESDCKYTLTRQGRMHEDILRLANALFYNKILSCVPLPHQVEQSTKPRATFTDIKPRKVLSINNMNANEAEAEAVIERLKTIPEGWSVGVITPYRAQIKEIERRI